MKKLLEEIREMIHFVTEVVYYYRKQNFAKGHTLGMSVINIGEQYFSDAAEAGFNDSIEMLFPIWKELLDATEAGDEIYLADIYEQRLIPVLLDIQHCIIDSIGGEPVVYWNENMMLLEEADRDLFDKLRVAKENEKREYILEWTSTGDMTLTVETKLYGKVKLSSYVNPWQEALLYSDDVYERSGDKCIIFGTGMGYHIKQILSLSFYREIIVLENDLEQLRICMMYADMQNVLKDKRVKIILCDEAGDYSKWLQADDIKGSITYKIWYPSIKTIEDDALRELLENYWVNCSSADNLGNILLDNFENNQKLGDDPVQIIKNEFSGKDMILVAGGPSLDDGIDYLRKISGKENARIVCVGTVAIKLIEAGVKPDYIVMIDGKTGTRWQTRGIEDCGVPLIYLSTAAHSVAADYQCKRYIAYQEGIEPSEKYAKDNGLTLYQSGGSVSTFAIDMAIRMECARVICVGLDLGYTGDNTHAGGVGRRLGSKKNMRQVEAVGGGLVYTSKTLDIYRRWIERRIENVDNIKFINSSTGARIHGMEEISLKQINAGYCKQTIYCYVEKTEKALDEFAEEHNKDSFINIYYSIIDSCEGKLFYCLGDIVSNYLKTDEKLWFATDVKELYDIVNVLYKNLFEKIIYIEQGNKRKFNCDFKIEELIEHFINIQRSKLQSLFMRRLRDLKEHLSLKDKLKFLYDLEGLKLENDSKNLSIWSCFCRMLIYEILQYKSEKDYFYYKLTIYSIIMQFEKSAYYSNLYLNEVVNNSKTDAENLYFVWNQYKRMLFRGLVGADKQTSDLLGGMYDRCYNIFENEVKESFQKIYLKDRNKNIIFITTIQLLDEKHAPTRTVIERARALKKLGKTVVLINTAEQYLFNGCLPVYNAIYGRVLEEYNDMQEITFGEDTFPFIQLPEELSEVQKVQVMTRVIYKLKPYYILSIGTGSIVADLCANIVPCAAMSLVFSSLPHTKNCIKILGRNFYENENLLDNDIIESRFTFELEEQKKNFTRTEFGIPENRFVLVVVGIRLTYDVKPEFLKMLQRVCGKGCYVVFAGIMDNYNVIMKEYPIVADNSLFIGFCDDILALMDICDLYVNPERSGGGFSVIEAFEKGKPGVYLKIGDVYSAGGEDFAVDTYDNMVTQILRYKEDKIYYDKMAEKAKIRAKYMTSSVEAISKIDNEICRIIEKKYW